MAYSEEELALLEADDEFELNLDASLATIKENKFRCEIKGASLHKKMQDDGNVNLSVAVRLSIVGGPYNNTFVNDYIGLDMSKPFNAKKITNFIESITGERLVGDIVVKFVKDADGKSMMAGVVGNEVGAFIATNDEGYTNVTTKGYLPLTAFADDNDEAPF